MNSPLLPLSFTARVIKGAGRGRAMGSPTINLDPADAPRALPEGIYACSVILLQEELPAALHYGPPIFFSDTTTCEVHVIDRDIERVPDAVIVRVTQFLRPIRNFDSLDDLRAQIQADIAAVRALQGGRE